MVLFLFVVVSFFLIWFDLTARQMGFKDGNECPKLCKLAYEYLKWEEGIDVKMYDYFASEVEICRISVCEGIRNMYSCLLLLRLAQSYFIDFSGLLSLFLISSLILRQFDFCSFAGTQCCECSR